MESTIANGCVAAQLYDHRQANTLLWSRHALRRYIVARTQEHNTEHSLAWEDSLRPRLTDGLSVYAPGNGLPNQQFRHDAGRLWISVCNSSAAAVTLRLFFCGAPYSSKPPSSHTVVAFVGLLHILSLKN